MRLPIPHRVGRLRISTGRLRRVHLGLATYGLVIALLGVSYLDQQLPKQGMTLQGGRQQMIENSIRVLDAGGPPLLASSVPYRQGLKDPRASFFEANQTDDPGIYLYLPVLGHLTGDGNALSLLKTFFIGSMALLLLSYPIVFYLLFDSVAVGILAPLVVLFGFGFLRNTEIYWVPAWVVMFCMPIVFLVARARWRRGTGLTALFLVAVVASYATSIRAAAGLPVAVAALAVAALRERRIALRVGAAAVVAVGYLSINTVGMDAIRAYRNHVAHLHVAPQSAANGHPFWHPAYLGLGYLPNKWSIRWNDSVALAAAQGVDRKVVYLSPHYNSILRKLYFKIVKSDPGYAFDLYTTKIAVSLNDAVGRFWLALLFLPAALLIGVRRREMVQNVALLAPAVLVTLAPPVMTVPYVYDVGWIGTAGFLSLLVLGWAVVTARQAVGRVDVEWRQVLEGAPATETVQAARDWSRSRLALLRPLRRPLLAAGFGMLLFVIVAQASAAKQAAKADAVFYQRDAGYLAPPQPSKLLVQRWSFGKGLPAGWQASTSTLVSAVGNASRITTNMATSEYQVVSPPIQAKPGGYVVQINGRPIAGGLGLGSLGVPENQWINTSYFFADMVGYNRERMSVAFTLAEGGTFKIILSNWARVPSTSTWNIRNIELSRQSNG